MTVFNLLTFPNVCRACLQSVHPDQMETLDTHRPLLDGTIGTFLQDITFRLPANVLPYLPGSVCIACLEVMEFFSKYRRKMHHLHEFLVALVRVKLGDELPLRELFESRTEQLELLFRDLDLCNATEAGVEDLLQEYDQYMIASMKQDDGDSNEQVDSLEDQIALAESVHLEELVPFEESAMVDEPVILEQLVPLDDPSEEEVTPDDNSIVEDEVEEESIPAKQIEKKKRKVIQTSKRSRLKIELEVDAEKDATGTDDSEGEKEKSNLDRERYQCEKCPYKSYHTVAFTMHTKKHQLNEGKVGYVCNNPFCLQLFGTVDELEQHKASNPHSRYRCEICGNELKHRVSLEVHMERHVGITRYECQYCSASFHTRTELTNHLAAIHISEDRAECVQCGAVFTSKKLLKQHLESHTLVRKFGCAVCGRPFKTQHHLNRHVKAVHTEDARFQCEHCDASYTRRDKWRLHVESFHGIQTYFVCDICVRSFDTSEALQEHRHHHEHPKKLECGTCLIVCLTQESFDRHTCITYQEDYVCCGRDFKYHMLYNKHMMSHGIKVNARVKPKTNLLLGQERAMRAAQLSKQSYQRKKNKMKSSKQTSTQQRGQKHVQKGENSVEIIEIKEEELFPNDAQQHRMD
ncbi:zinc finger protein 2-like [Anopheles arabiensis]|uniref:zinc finger protein 2-like n=1 Tax=Anopheles arabiensis TaxID=7173 RepID=UPI001AACDFC1|nr:zinc finger protein 2-like [Anopheles arabiensis]